ncbi:MAG: transposase [Chloroflexi bacterium]|nr:transposase [Chloroflexota bacterium]
MKRRNAFAKRLRDEFPAAVDTLERDWGRMVTFHNYSEEHWKHLRTTNPVESPFAAVRLRTDAGKRYKRVVGATALIWRLLMVAEQRFRKLDGSEFLPNVYAGVTSKDGKRVAPQQQSNAMRKNERPPDLPRNSRARQAWCFRIRVCDRHMAGSLHTS